MRGDVMLEGLKQSKRALEDKIRAQRSVLSMSAKNENLTGEGLAQLALRIVKSEAELQIISNHITVMERFGEKS